MKVSGKYIVIALFVVAIGLGLVARWGGSKPHITNSGSHEKHKPGYRKKFFQTFENAKAMAEKQINQDPKHKNMIVRYESKPEGWVFYFESLHYLTSGDAKDREQGPNAILVRPDNTVEFIK